MIMELILFNECVGGNKSQKERGGREKSREGRTEKKGAGVIRGRGRTE